MNSHAIGTFAAAAVLCSLQACTSDVEPDENHFGAENEQLTWSFEQKVAGFRNMDKISWTRTVPAGDSPYLLPRADVDLSKVEFEHAGKTWTVDEFVERQGVAGLIVVKRGAVAYERYELGNTAATRWVSYSVAKSVVSMLIGAAINDGYIESTAEKVTDYLPRLKNSSYDQSNIRSLLQMASGVAWNEDYTDPESDISVAPWHTLALNAYLRSKPRAAAPGEKFNYNTAEANLVGSLLRSAVGNNLSTYLSEKIWKPFGMEHDGYWVLSEEGGGEFGGSSLSATLRDYARIGLFAMTGGVLADGSRVLPEAWMVESTTPSQGHPGYGYFWWLRGNGAFAASGIYGQAIHVDAAENVVIAMHSAREAASTSEDSTLQLAMFGALIRATSRPR